MDTLRGMFKRILVTRRRHGPGYLRLPGRRPDAGVLEPVSQQGPRPLGGLRPRRPEDGERELRRSVGLGLRRAHPPLPPRHGRLPGSPLGVPRGKGQPGARGGPRRGIRRDRRRGRDAQGRVHGREPHRRFARREGGHAGRRPDRSRSKASPSGPRWTTSSTSSAGSRGPTCA